jgi:hypothetical protein
MLNREQIDQFWSDGFLAVRGVVDQGTLSRLRDTIVGLIDKTRPMTQSDKVFELDPKHTAAEPRLRRINHPPAVAPIFWEVATSAALLDCVQSLIGDNIKFHHSKLNMKAAKGGEEIGWHQEYPFFPHTNFDLLACGVALEDATPENGCLLVIPGTHRLGPLNHRTGDGEFIGKITGDADKFDASAAVPVNLKAGDVSIHHACVIHGSSANLSPRPRPLLIYQYAPCDAIALDKKPPANEFSVRVVRGKPATHARLAGEYRIELRGDSTGAKSIFERQKSMAMT